LIHRPSQKGKDKKEVEGKEREEGKNEEGDRGRILMSSCNSRRMVFNLQN
jgi:hypothetical protein